MIEYIPSEWTKPDKPTKGQGAMLNLQVTTKNSNHPLVKGLQILCKQHAMLDAEYDPNRMAVTTAFEISDGDAQELNKLGWRYDGAVWYWDDIIRLAKACHNANAAIANEFGQSMPEWDDAPQYQKDSSITLVKRLLDNPSLTPKTLHDEWLNERKSQGWKYGSIRNEQLKTNPAMVEYNELPAYQKAKDSVLKAIINAQIQSDMDIR